MANNFRNPWTIDTAAVLKTGITFVKGFQYIASDPGDQCVITHSDGKPLVTLDSVNNTFGYSDATPIYDLKVDSITATTTLQVTVE